MINKQDFYLKDIDLLRQLETIMVKKHITEDDWLCWSEPENDECGNPLVSNPQWYLQSERGECWEEEGNNGLVPVADDYCRTYRKDSLEAALPDDCWKGLPLDKLYKKYGTEQPNEIIDRAMDLLWLAIKGDARGQESLIALAQLIILLDKEGVE